MIIHVNVQDKIFNGKLNYIIFKDSTNINFKYLVMVNVLKKLMLKEN